MAKNKSGGKGSHHGNGANTRRTERRYNRYHSNLNLRIKALDKSIVEMTKSRDEWQESHPLHATLDRKVQSLKVERDKLVRMADKPRKRANSHSKGNINSRSKWERMRSDLSGAFSKHPNDVARAEMERAS